MCSGVESKNRVMIIGDQFYNPLSIYLLRTSILLIKVFVFSKTDGSLMHYFCSSVML